MESLEIRRRYKFFIKIDVRPIHKWTGWALYLRIFDGIEKPSYEHQCNLTFKEAVSYVADGVKDATEDQELVNELKRQHSGQKPSYKVPAYGVDSDIKLQKQICNELNDEKDYVKFLANQHRRLKGPIYKG